MRRRRPLLLAALLAGAFLLLYFSVGNIGGPTDDGEGETALAPPPDAGAPEKGTTAEKPDPPAVRGRIVDPDGKGLGGARIRIVALDAGKRIEAVTTADGEGRFVERTLRHGKIFFVEALKPGYPAVRKRPKDLELRPGRTVELDLAVPETFTLAGHVQSRSGQPVSGLEVRFGDYRGETDDVGKFRIEGIRWEIVQWPTPPALEARRDGKLLGSAPVQLDGPETNYLDNRVQIP